MTEDIHKKMAKMADELEAAIEETYKNIKRDYEHNVDVVRRVRAHIAERANTP